MSRKNIQHWNGEVIHPESTPNVVVENPDVRFWLGGSLFAASLIAGIAALFFSFFPEIAAGTDIPMRAIAFVNALVSLLSSTFGLVVSTPNVPRRVEP